MVELYAAPAIHRWHDVPVHRLYEVNDAAAAFYSGLLPDALAAARYLRRHGLPGPAPAGWRLGYAPALWTPLTDHLRERGFTDGEITAAGLGFVHRASGHVLDRFRDRLIFPITDPRDRVIAFTARDLSGHADATWINTPHTAIYHKGQTLYGLGQRLAHPPPSARAGGDPPIVLVVEGAADVLAIGEMAATRPPPAPPVCAVAPCGTRLTDHHLGLLARELPGAHLVLAFDGDAPGREAIHRLYPIAVRWPGPVSGIRLPDGEDPADLLAASGPEEALAALLNGVQPLPAIQLTIAIDRLFTTGRITNPAKFAEDRLLAYRTIADLFLDAPHAARMMAETAAERLGLPVTDVTRGVIEVWEAHAEASREAATADPTTAPRTMPAARTAADAPTADRTTPTAPVPAQAVPARAVPAARQPSPTGSAGTIRMGSGPTSGSARTGSRRATATSEVVTRHDPGSGVTVWALADGIGRHAHAATAAAVAAGTAADTALRYAPEAGVYTARAAVNALYDGVHPGQAGDASLIVIAAYPDDDAPRRTRFEIAWAGDCRAYTVHAGRLTQVTTDRHDRSHRPSGRPGRQPARPGHGTSADPTATPDPTGAVGSGALLGATVRTGDIGVRRLVDGPLMICTDIVHRTVPRTRLAVELADLRDPQATADRLIDTLRNRGTGGAAVLVIEPAPAHANRTAA